MRAVAGHRNLSARPARPLNFPRPGAVTLCRVLTVLALSGILSACSGTSTLVPASSPTGYQLRYGLGGSASLLVSSPDLNRRLAEQQRQPSLLDLSTTRSRAAAAADLPDDLKIEYSTPEQDQKSKLMFHFAEEGRFLERASFDSNILVQNWLLGFNANMAPTPENAASRSFHLESEVSGLFGMRQASPQPQSIGQMAGRDEDPLGPNSSIPAVAGRQDPATLRLANPARDLSPGRFVPAPKHYYLAFHDASFGAEESGTVKFLFSLGGYPAEDFGELVTTYRLLSMNEPSESTGGQRDSVEQAVAIGYNGHFSSWIKSFGHTLTYFTYHGPGIEEAEQRAAGQDLTEQATSYKKWQSRVQLSCGEDLRWPAQGILQGYRIDLQLETQAALQRTGLLPTTSHPAPPAWGSQLRLKTDFGTLSGKVSRSASQHRLGFSLQKTALTGARVRLYYEDIDYRSLGELETRVGGQLNLPFDDTLLKVLTLGYWRNTEVDLFAAQSTKGYTAPRRGQHVPTLNNATPGILQ